eukprot:9003959-Pyramimonas_sp.AAC.2
MVRSSEPRTILTARPRPCADGGGVAIVRIPLRIFCVIINIQPAGRFEKGADVQPAEGPKPPCSSCHS